MTFLYKSDPVRGRVWQEVFAQHAPQLNFQVWPDAGDPARVRFIAAWTLPPLDLKDYPQLEVVFCTGAGIDKLGLEQIPADVKVVRMIEPGLTAGMVEYVTLAVLSLHRDWQPYATQQRAQVWKALPVRAASGRRVGVMGLGELGVAVALALRGLGFPCHGWSRSPKQLGGVQCFHGPEGLDAFLANTDYLVCLLPLTPQTRGILDRQLFSRLPRGAAVINVGRGAQLIQEDLLAALDDGQLGAAILDVCDPEPLPSGHPLWSHPRVVITPHIASETQPGSAAPAVLDNIARHQRGEPMVGLIDRRRGY